VIDPENVTACLVTRGDQPLKMEEIRDSLIFENVVVWDNEVETFDAKCAGRYFAALRSSTDVVYFQDDDVLVPEETQRALCGAYIPGMLTATWGHGENPDGYDDLPLVCGGAVVDRWVAWRALSRYLAVWPMDEAFLYESDFVAGVLYPGFAHFDPDGPGFEIDYAIAQHRSRLVNQPWQRDLKFEVTQRARAIRDGDRETVTA
jgi:hypothetical protein